MLPKQQKFIYFISRSKQISFTYEQFSSPLSIAVLLLRLIKVKMTEEDRLSLLPDDTLHCILSYLPIDSAIRTGTLSKRWLHLWKFVSTIHFASLPEIENEMDYRYVDRCLSHVQTPKLSKLVIVARFGLRAEPSIAKWVDFAVAKHVRCLEFYMEIAVKDYLFRDGDLRDDWITLPNSFYLQNTAAREQIALTCVEFSPPPPLSSFSGFVSLTRLFLFYSTICDEVLQLIMSTSIRLESLTIIRCWGLENPKISSVTLKEFVYIKYCEELGTEIEIDAPNLVSLYTYGLASQIVGFNKSCHPLKVGLYDSWFDPHVFVNAKHLLMGQLSKAQVFGVRWSLFPFLADALHYNGGPHNTFKSLREFSLAECVPRKKDEIIILMKFLGDCPSLETIILEFEGLGGFWDSELPMIPPTEPYVCKDEDVPPTSEGYFDDEEQKQLLREAKTLHQVKTLELYHYNTYRKSGEFLKFVLQKAVRLERIILFYEAPKHHVMRDLTVCAVPHHLRLRYLEHVSRLPRASPGVQLTLG